MSLNDNSKVIDLKSKTNKKTKPYPANINPDYIFSFAEKGIARASGFAGAVLNSQNILDIKRWCIDDQFAIIPELQNEENTINEFKSFVVKNALCEMTMLFETTLKNLYCSLLLFENTKAGTEYNIKTHEKLLKKFISNDFDKKIEIINELLNNDDENDELWLNLKYTRNCIAHNHSLVNNGTIKLTIPTFTAKYINNTTGEEIYTDPENSIVNMEKFAGYPMTVIIDAERREKIFNTGDIISFKKHEIIFLIHTFKQSINSLKIKYLEYLLNNKVIFDTKNGIIRTKEELEKAIKNNRNTLVFELVAKGAKE